MKYDSIPKAVKEKIEAVIPSEINPVPLHAPEFSQEDCELVNDCINSGWVSSAGKFVNEFEENLAKKCDANYAVAVVNGTAALEVALKIVGVKAGEEIIMPSLTFVATANAACHLGAIPHFIDVSEEDWTISPSYLRRYLNSILTFDNKMPFNKYSGNKVAAIVPMHTFGHPAAMDELNAICKEFDIPLVEDAAESVGSLYKGKSCGGLGLVGAVSFNGNKIITTGGGGAIITNDENLAIRARHLTTTAKCPHKWDYYHDEIAYNYRMPNINAALGVAQLKSLDVKIREKRKLAVAYQNAFCDFDDVKFFTEPGWAKSNYWLNAIKLSMPNLALRNDILEVLNSAGLQSRPIWTPLHLLPMYKNMPRSEMKATEALAHSVINIPSSPNLARYLL
jgi:perosamine synthetase